MMGLTKATVGPEGKHVSQLYSSSLRGGGFSTILPGETQTIRVGYGISAADAKNVRIEVRAPNVSDRSAIFKGAIS